MEINKIELDQFQIDLRKKLSDAYCRGAAYMYGSFLEFLVSKKEEGIEVSAKEIFEHLREVIIKLQTREEEK